MILRYNPVILDLIYEDAIQKLANLKGITIEESRQEITKMSFKQYHNLLEAGANITPPSGQAIGPSAGAPAQGGAPSTAPIAPSGTSAPAQGSQSAPSKAQVMWNGPGSPIEQGMTVGLKGPNGLPVAGEITQVDQGANGVKVKNPTTGQEEWHGNDDLQTYSDNTSAPGASPQSAALQQQQQVAEDIRRMRQLAGIAEDGSGGCTGAGSVGGGVPVALGGMKRRTATEEAPAVEYTPGVAKTVAGDTKPNQASGKLSADLAARGKKTAARINNGFKK